MDLLQSGTARHLLTSSLYSLHFYSDDYNIDEPFLPWAAGKHSKRRQQSTCLASIITSRIVYQRSCLGPHLNRSWLSLLTARSCVVSPQIGGNDVKIHEQIKKQLNPELVRVISCGCSDGSNNLTGCVPVEQKKEVAVVQVSCMRMRCMAGLD